MPDENKNENVNENVNKIDDLLCTKQYSNYDNYGN